MPAMTVYLPDISDVAEFVGIISKFPMKTQLHVGHYVVDAKSIMGIFTLDREQPVLLEADAADEAEFTRLQTALARFTAAPAR